MILSCAYSPVNSPPPPRQTVEADHINAKLHVDLVCYFISTFEYFLCEVNITLLARINRANDVQGGGFGVCVISHSVFM